MRVKNPKVRDAVRVPRVVGTRRRVSVMVEAFTTARKARPFDELANRILPTCKKSPWKRTWRWYQRRLE